LSEDRLPVGVVPRAMAWTVTQSATATTVDVVGSSRGQRCAHPLAREVGLTLCPSVQPAEDLHRPVVDEDFDLDDAVAFPEKLRAAL